MGARRVALAVTVGLFTAATPAPGASPVECSTTGDTRCESWWSSWNSGDGGERGDRPVRIEDSAVAPDGGTVYVTGTVPAGDTGSDALTLALDTRSGQRRWVRRYNAAPADGIDFNTGRAVAVSSTGRRVFVAGYQDAGPDGETDWMLLSYRSADGRLLWATSPRAGFKEAVDLVLSPDGRRVFVTGVVRERQDTMTIAFSARTGGVRWRSRYASGEGTVRPSQIEVSRSGRRLFVLAAAQRADTGRYDTTLLSYRLRAASPRLASVTVTHENGDPFLEEQMGVSPDGSAVFVSGGAGTHSNAARTKTVRVDAGTGAIVWSAPEEELTAPVVEVDPDSSAVYVAAHAGGGRVAAIARAARSGAVEWSVLADDPRWSHVAEAAVDGERDLLVVAGARLKHEPRPGDGYTTDPSSDLLVLAFDTATGAERWAARSNYPDTPYGYVAAARSVSVARDGWVFAAGDVSYVSETDVQHQAVVAGYEPDV